MKKLALTAVLMAGVAFVPVHADQAAAAKAGCAGCHMMDKSMIGPSIKDMAAKLKGSNVDELVAFVKTGTTGAPKWGGMKMPANGTPEADVRKILEWMLAQ